MAEKIKFRYHIKDDHDTYRQGEILATSADALKANFANRNFTLLSEPEPVVGTGLNREINIGFKRKSVKRKEVALFARKFSVMIDAGIPMKKMLSVMVNTNTMSDGMRDALNDISDQINAGALLSTAMEKHPLIFDELFVSMVRAGEKGGFLDQSMRQVAENLEAEIKLKAKIKSAMTYPVVVLVLAAVMVTAMLIFIVPVFDEMFKSLGGELPLPTKILVHLSNFLKVAIIPIVVVIVAFIVWWSKNKHKESVRSIVDPWQLKIPVLGKLFRKVSLSRYNRNLSTLLVNGVPILKAMEIVATTTGNIVYKRATDRMRLNLQRGDKFADVMQRESVFPGEDVEMVRVGDDAGDVVPMLQKISVMYDDDVEATTEALTALIEPLLIVFLGVVVGAMVIALYMPIFSIYDVIQQQ